MLQSLRISIPRSIARSRHPLIDQPLLRPRRAYTTNMAQHGHSAACCSIPPIFSQGYVPKGEYHTFGGLKTYVTGPPKATKAILFIYDIFGFFPQTLQGADILSTSHENKYLVFMPDWFEGKPADISWYPPTTDEHRAALGNFFQTTGAPPTTVARVPETLGAIQKEYPLIEAVGIVGLCWGGKVTALSSKEGTKFKAAAQCHPAMVDPNDAPAVKIPMALLASKDEDPEDVKKFKNNLTKTNLVETFGDQIHGWMGARSNLDDARVKSEYERGYKTLLTFFADHL